MRCASLAVLATLAVACHSLARCHAQEEGSSGSASSPGGALDELALLQSGLTVSSRGASAPAVPAARSQSARRQPEHGDLHCASFSASLRGMLWWTLPFVLPMMLVSWGLAAWVEAARGREADGVAAEGPGEAPGRMPKGPAAEGRDVDPLLMALLAVGAFIQALNFTIAMPSSEQIMVAAGGTTFLSGLCIGAYPVGSIACLPAIMHFSRHSYRGGMLFLAATAVLGNVAYGAAASARGPWAVLGLLLARMFCGLEGGCIIVFNNACVRLSSGAGIARATANLVASACLGFVAGPACSSLCQQLFPRAPPELPPAVLMVAVGALYGAATALRFPSQEEAFKQAGLLDQAPAADADAGAAPTDVQSREAWLHLAVQSILFALRLFLRVAWEMGALLILDRSYGLSTKEVGFVVALPVLGSLPLLLYADLLHGLGMLYATCLLSFLELLGILLMFRVDLPGRWPLVIFMLGSWIFYGANWASSVPIAPLRPRFALKGHWLLNVEATTCTMWICGFVGTFYGPVLSRAVLGGCTSQNMLAASFLATWAVASLAVEVGLHVLLRQRKSA